MSTDRTETVNLPIAPVNLESTEYVSAYQTGFDRGLAENVSAQRPSEYAQRTIFDSLEYGYTPRYWRPSENGAYNGYTTARATDSVFAETVSEIRARIAEKIAEAEIAAQRATMRSVRLPLPETITAIAEIETETVSGFAVTTDRQTVTVAIDNDQICCEDWGYMATNDNLTEYIGAVVSDILITDSAMITNPLHTDYTGDAVFVTFETDRGRLQFVAYNAHNGYYSHEITVTARDIDFAISM